MSVYFEEVSKKINICFEDLVKLVCLPEILKIYSVFGYSPKYLKPYNYERRVKFSTFNEFFVKFYILS